MRILGSQLSQAVDVPPVCFPFMNYNLNKNPVSKYNELDKNFWSRCATYRDLPRWAGPSRCRQRTTSPPPSRFSSPGAGGLLKKRWNDRLQHQTYLYNAALYAIFDDELDGMHRAMLTKTMDAVHSLCDKLERDLKAYRDIRSLRYSTAGFHLEYIQDQLTQSQESVIDGTYQLSMRYTRDA